MKAVLVLFAALAIQMRFQLCAGGAFELLLAVLDSGGREFENIFAFVPFVEELADYADSHGAKGSFLVPNDAAVLNVKGLKDEYGVNETDWEIWMNDVSMYHFTKEPISSLGYGEGKVMRAWGPELDTEFEVGPAYTAEESGTNTTYRNVTRIGECPRSASFVVGDPYYYKGVEIYILDKFLVPGALGLPPNIPYEVAVDL